jgi:DNA-binding MarR family transcriptional regulator
MLQRERDLDEAVLLLHHAFRGVTRESNARLEKRKLNRLHQRLMYTLEAHSGLSVSEFMAVYGASKQALTRPIRELVSGGYVEERASEKDGRVKHLFITARGRALNAFLSEPLYACFERAFQKSGAKDRDGWLRVMRALALASPTYAAERDAR